MASHKITLSQSSWTADVAALYFDDVSKLFYDSAELTNEVTAIPPPTREGWQFDGFYASSSVSARGAQYITPEGGFTDEFWDYCIAHLTGSATMSIYIFGTQKAWKLTLNVNGGTAGSGTQALWYALDGTGWHEDDQCQGDVVHAVTPPKYDAKLFKGYFNGTSTPGTQYIDMDGNFLPAMESLTLTAAKTISANWATPVKITVSANSGSGGTAAFYRDQLRGIWYLDTSFTVPVEKIVPHTRECFELLGFKKTNSDTGAQAVAPDGTIDPTWEPTSNTTIYARWRRISWKCTISNNSGEGGTPAIYYKLGTTPNEFYFDDQCTTAVEQIEVPTRSGYSLRGVFSAKSGGTEYITREGLPTAAVASLSITEAKTFYAQWKVIYTITIDDRGGAGGSGRLYYDSLGGQYYTEQGLETVATSVAIPERECYAFTGYWSTASGGTRYINGDGTFTADFQALAPTSAKTIYAQWTRISYKVTLDDNEGAGGAGQLYSNGTDAMLFADDQCTEQIVVVAVPTRAGHTFLGYYQTKTDGSRYIDQAGRVLVAVPIPSDTTIWARWTANQYTLTFDYNGGSGSTETKTVTYGQPVGALPAVASPSPKQSFDAWTVDGKTITDSTVWEHDGDKTAVVRWRFNFGDVVDYFEIGDAHLLPISSGNGDEKQRVCVTNAGSKNGRQIGAGRFSDGVSSVGCIWRNPSVTYAIVGATTVNIRLGKAYPATFTGYGNARRMTISGWMIVSAKISTAIGQPPTLTIEATANEGADAINLFDVAIPVSPRAKAQNLLGAVVGGGNLQNCEAVAACSPVVCEENLAPCASDVVMGQLTITATTVAPNNEPAPTAGEGFTSVGEPKTNGDKDYLTWNITLKKEIV